MRLFQGCFFFLSSNYNICLFFVAESFHACTTQKSAGYSARLGRGKILASNWSLVVNRLISMFLSLHVHVHVHTLKLSKQNTGKGNKSTDEHTLTHIHAWTRKSVRAVPPHFTAAVFFNPFLDVHLAYGYQVSKCYCTRCYIVFLTPPEYLALYVSPNMAKMFFFSKSCKKLSLKLRPDHPHSDKMLQT